MPVVALPMKKDSSCYKGVRLASGQELLSQKLILDSSFAMPSQLDPPSYLMHSLQFLHTRDVKGKVARGICISGTSLKTDMPNLLVFYPPQSCTPSKLLQFNLSR